MLYGVCEMQWDNNVDGPCLQVCIQGVLVKFAHDLNGLHQSLSIVHGQISRRAGKLWAHSSPCNRQCLCNAAPQAKGTQPNAAGGLAKGCGHAWRYWRWVDGSG